MRKDFEKLFSHLEPPEPPKDLLDTILVRIRRERQIRQARWRFGVFVMFLFGSAFAGVPAFQSMQRAAEESGARQFLSLVFSDPKLIMEYLDGFSLAILETIPAASIALFLSVIFVFLNSLKYLARDFTIVFRQTKI